ncbi:MAG: alcohol dehydrogenase catalytic domain-containing protein [Candidatus Omnitrophota bacterium]
MMKAAYLVGKEKIEIKETPVPVPGPAEVLVRVKKVGICGSDVHYFREGRIGEQVVTFPFIVGHEAAGIVAETGPEVKGLLTGQKVAIDPGVSCGKCEVCLTGKPNLCLKVRFLGTPPVEGAFREYLVIPAANLIPLPDNVTLEEGALSEPLAVGLYATRLVSIALDDKVAIFGCGPIGLSLLLCARLAGASTLFASDLIPERRTYAKRIGADYVFDPKECDPVKEILGLTKGKGVQVTFESAGQLETLIQAVGTAALGGKVGIVGIPIEDYWQIPSYSTRRKELAFFNVRRSAFAAEKVINLMASGKIDAKGMVSYRFPLERVTEGLQLAAEYRDGVIKAMIDI